MDSYGDHGGRANPFLDRVGKPNFAPKDKASIFVRVWDWHSIHLVLRHILHRRRPAGHIGDDVNLRTCQHALYAATCHRMVVGNQEIDLAWLGHTGTNLASATAVDFGKTAAKIVSDTATQIVVTSPAGTGTVDVTVTTAGGTSATSAADKFTYTATKTKQMVRAAAVRDFALLSMAREWTIPSSGSSKKDDAVGLPSFFPIYRTTSIGGSTWTSRGIRAPADATSVWLDLPLLKERFRKLAGARWVACAELFCTSRSTRRGIEPPHCIQHVQRRQRSCAPLHFHPRLHRGVHRHPLLRVRLCPIAP